MRAHAIPLAVLRLLLWAITAALVLAVAVALTPRGTALLARTLPLVEPRLAIAWRDGSLLEARFDRIAWRDGELAVTLDGVAWTLAPRCLLTDALCFEELDVATLDIDLGPASGGKTPLALAPVLLPLPLEIDAGTLGELLIRRGNEPLLALQDIALAGSLKGSRVELARLSARRNDLAVSLAGHVDLRGQLPLAAAGRVTRGSSDRADVTVEGDLARLAFGLRTEGRFALDANGTADLLARPVALELLATSRAPFAPWGEDPWLGVLQDARLSVHGTLAELRAGLTARLESAMLGTNALAAQASWSPGHARLDEFALNGAAGTLAGTGELATAGERRWRVRADATEFCPVGWSPAVDCRLSGSAELTGMLDAPLNALALSAALDGSVNGHPARIGGRIEALPEGSWRLEGVRVQSGANALEASGTWGAQSHIDATLALGNLADTVATARGKGRGTLALRGSPVAPALAASLQLEGLAWKDLAAGALEFSADWQGAASDASVAKLTLRDARWGDLEHASLEATLAGSPAAHRLALSVRAAENALALDCRGALAADRGDWSGSCAELRVTSGIGASQWRNDRTLALAWRQTGRTLSLEPFCLQSSNATLCSTGRTTFGRDSVGGLALTGTRIPAAWLGPWLPGGLELDGDLDLRLDADKAAGRNPRIDGRLEAGALSLTALAAGEPLRLAVDRALVSLRSRDAGMALDWELALRDGAGFSGALLLGDTTRGSALEGTMALRDFDLAPMALTAPGVVSAAGTLDGSVRLAGSLHAPLASGSFALRNGRLVHERLPKPLEDVALAVEFAGREVRLAGQFRVDRNTGTLDGTARFDDTGWSADVGLHAQDLQLEPMRDSRLTVSPELRVLLAPQHATISGEVAVPAADIRLDRLPPTAVSVSPDAVIVGAEPAAAPFDYTANVRVTLGRAVRLRGKGVDARLDGSVELLKTSGEPLRARGEITIPEGRYSAYGQQLRVTEGRFLFSGPLNRPQLQLTAMRRIEDEDVQVGVRVRGELGQPELSTFSRPAMEESRALHYLLTGRAPEAGENTDLAVSGLLLQLGSAGATRVGGNVMQGFGIQDFELASRQVEGGTEVHLSGYLTPDLYLRYGVSTFDKINTFRLRYRLSESFHVEAVSGIENAVDFLYSFER